jgi:hypothetical protein
MRVVVSTLFCVVHFPHQGKVITVDQLVLFNLDTRTGNIPFIAKTPLGLRECRCRSSQRLLINGHFPHSSAQ